MLQINLIRGMEQQVRGQFLRVYKSRWHQENKERTRPARNSARRKWRRENKAKAKKQRHADYLKYKPQEIARSLEWQANNPQKTRDIACRNYRNHREVRLASRKDYVRNNPEKCKNAIQRWRKVNSLLVALYRQQRRARVANAPGTHTYEQWMARISYYGWRCAYCWIELTTETLTKDHVIPLSRRGSDFASNLVPSCFSCNCRKNKKTAREFLAVH